MSSLPLQLAMGKMMEQGPVLIITFQAQLVMVIKNPKGEVVEGDPVSPGGIGPRGWPVRDWLMAASSHLAPTEPGGFVTAQQQQGSVLRSLGPCGCWWGLEGD